MKYFIIAGEASGDLHGSNLMKAIKNKDHLAEFVFLGGDLMQQQGGHMIIHYRQMAFMGVVQVILNLKTVLSNMRICKKALINSKPDAVILIDYAGFNLKIARFAKTHGYKVFFYISPKVWAWRESRVKKIKQYIDKMFVILPFEKEFYLKHNYEVIYVGNPLLDAIRDFNENEMENHEIKQNVFPEKYIALLPGSRKQEVNLLLGEMLECARHFSDYSFVLAAAPSLPKEFYTNFPIPANVTLVYNQTYHVLKHAFAAIVTSGTATLETGLFEVPQVVVYKTNQLQFTIGSLIVDIKKFKYFSLVNLILGRESVKEILQKNIARDAIIELSKILKEDNHRKRILEDYTELKQKIGQYRPSDQMAENIVKALSY